MDETFRILFEHIPAAAVIQDAGLGRFIDANGRAAALFRMPRDELLGQSFSSLSAPGAGAGMDALDGAIAAASRGEPSVIGWTCRDARGFPVPCGLSLFRLPPAASELVCGIITDERDRRTLLERLRRSRAQLREISTQLGDSIEDERARISRELHDQLGQLITAAKINVAGIRRSVDKLPHSDELLEELRDRTEVTSGVIDQILERVRSIAAELRPEGLDALGLAAATSADLEIFASRTGIRVIPSIDPNVDSLPKKVSTVLFRCMHELLTNVARHAEATRVDVRLRYEDGTTVLEVIDDGVGIGGPAQRSSLGLLGMDERVSELDGTVTFGEARRDEDPGGTSVRIVIPLTGSAA